MLPNSSFAYPRLLFYFLPYCSNRLSYECTACCLYPPLGLCSRFLFFSSPPSDLLDLASFFHLISSSHLSFCLSGCPLDLSLCLSPYSLSPGAAVYLIYIYIYKLFNNIFIHKYIIYLRPETRVNTFKARCIQRC